MERGDVRLLSDAVDLLSGETDMVVHAGQTDSETYFLNIWLAETAKKPSL